MKNRDHYVLFMGVKINKVLANRIGIGIIFGAIGGILSIIILHDKYIIISYVIIIFFVILGFLIVGPKLFK